jgi:DNA-binding response OmpR family regulator
MGKRVFIIDDERAMIEIAKNFLEQDRYVVEFGLNPVDALREVRSDPPDLILLDICMDEMDGLEVCRQLKADPKTASLPIIFLSVKADDADVVAGLELGADDYIRKPPRGPEFLARVKAVLRRHGSPSGAGQLESGPFKIDYGAYRAWLNGKELDLTPKQFELLAMFLKNDGKVLTRRALWSSIWGADLSGSSRAIDHSVDKLRGKLGRYRNCITGLKGVGYRFEAPQ